MFHVVTARHLQFVCIERTEGVTIDMPNSYKVWDISPFTILYRVVKYFVKLQVKYTGGDSSVNIATMRRSGGQRIESWWRRGFPYPSSPTLEPTQPPVQSVSNHLPEDKSARASR
jgi:hypothetical protein